MAFRERPYSAFNFLVSGIAPDKSEPNAGFQEISGPSVEITVQEYRAGNKKGNFPDKITGVNKVPDITLKRGVMGDKILWDWLQSVRDGAQEQAVRTVTIELLSEERDLVQTWTLFGARPMKYAGPALSGKATDVAIDELTLSIEDIKFEVA